jgi:hypothetical protein
MSKFQNVGEFIPPFMANREISSWKSLGRSDSYIVDQLTRKFKITVRKAQSLLEGYHREKFAFQSRSAGYGKSSIDSALFSVGGGEPELGIIILAENGWDKEVKEALIIALETGRYQGFHMEDIELISDNSTDDRVDVTVAIEVSRGEFRLPPVWSNFYGMNKTFSELFDSRLFKKLKTECERLTQPSLTTGVVPQTYSFKELVDVFLREYSRQAEYLYVMRLDDSFDLVDAKGNVTNIPMSGGRRASIMRVASIKEAKNRFLRSIVYEDYEMDIQDLVESSSVAEHLNHHLVPFRQVPNHLRVKSSEIFVDRGGKKFVIALVEPTPLIGLSVLISSEMLEAPKTRGARELTEVMEKFRVSPI